MRRFLLCTGWIIAVTWAGGFQPVQAYAAEARVLVSEVTDSRSSKGFFAKCELELIIMGSDVADSLGVRSVRIHYATDDTGRILSEKKSQEPGFFHFNEEKDHKMTTKVDLKNPSREAKYIQSVKGEIELFQPDPKNGSQAVIKSFLAQPGKLLKHPALKKNKVQVSYVTKEIYEAQKKREMENAKHKGVEQAGQELGEAFGKMFEGLFAGFMGDEKNSVHLVIHDPENRVVEFDFQDSHGNRVKPMSRSNMGKLRTYGFKEPPSPDLQLVVYMATEESVKVVPFSLDKVALP